MNHHESNLVEAVQTMIESHVDEKLDEFSKEIQKEYVSSDSISDVVEEVISNRRDYHSVEVDDIDGLDSHIESEVEGFCKDYTKEFFKDNFADFFNETVQQHNFDGESISKWFSHPSVQKELDKAIKASLMRVLGSLFLQALPIAEPVPQPVTVNNYEGNPLPF